MSQKPDSRSDQTAAAESDPDEATIAQIALRAATFNGDKAPSSVKWIRGTRSVLAHVFGFNAGGPTVNDPEILIQLVGDFTSPIRKGPARSSMATRTHRGTVILLILDPATWETTDFGIRYQQVDLTDNGPIYELKV